MHILLATLWLSALSATGLAAPPAKPAATLHASHAAAAKFMHAKAGEHAQHNQGWHSRHLHIEPAKGLDTSWPIGLSVLLALTCVLFYRRHRHEDPSDPAQPGKPQFRTKLKTVRVNPTKVRAAEGDGIVLPPRAKELPPAMRLHFRLYPQEEMQWSSSFKRAGRSYGFLALTDRRLLAVTYRTRLGWRPPFVHKTMRRDEFPLAVIRGADVVLTHRGGLLILVLLGLWSYPVGMAFAGGALAVYVGWQRRQVAVEVDTVRLLFPLAPLAQREVLHILQPTVAATPTRPPAAAQPPGAPGPPEPPEPPDLAAS